MTEERVADYEAFLAIVDQGGLAAAARRLSRSPQSIGRSLAALENGLGVALLRRTTRRVAPTAAGVVLATRLRPALADIALARAEAAREGQDVAGLLRVGAPLQFGPPHVVPAVAAFLARYPEAEAEVLLSDVYADLLADELDLAVRIGPLPDTPNLIARRLAALRRVFAAAPGYLAARGRPARPEDLAARGGHDCVLRALPQDRETWEFSVAGHPARIEVAGRLRVGTLAACAAAALAGCGVAAVPLWLVRREVDAGSLELVLPEFEPSPLLVHAVWPASRGLAARGRAFLDVLGARLTAERL
jgi:DNA-binding transcriptional LysR family regulator